MEISCGHEFERSCYCIERTCLIYQVTPLPEIVWSLCATYHL